MRFEWDPAKSDACLRDRGFDFALASLIFERQTLEHEDTREQYGERRFVATGIADGMVITLCYTDRIAADGVARRRIISAHRSSRRERKAYAEAIQSVGTAE